MRPMVWHTPERRVAGLRGEQQTSRACLGHPFVGSRPAIKRGSREKNLFSRGQGDRRKTRRRQINGNDFTFSKVQSGMRNNVSLVLSRVNEWCLRLCTMGYGYLHQTDFSIKISWTDYTIFAMPIRF